MRYTVNPTSGLIIPSVFAELIGADTIRKATMFAVMDNKHNKEIEVFATREEAEALQTTLEKKEKRRCGPFYQ